ncbi:MAG: helix-turn-helix transcriptional regulator [Clostridia bacterium]|nr:helix-turn-helix transcriptional regulator [Clostridia bacterium]
MRMEEIRPFVRQALVGTLNKTNMQDVYVRIKSVDCRLFYILSGVGSMTIAGVRYHIAPGTVILFRAGTEYIWEIEKVRYYAVNFDYTHAFAHIRETFHPVHSAAFHVSQVIECPFFTDTPSLNAPIVLQDAPVQERMLNQITTEYCVRGAYTDMLLSALLTSVIISVVQMAADEKRPKEHANAALVRRIIDFINTRYDSNTSNESIAEHFHFNSAYLNRIFKAYTGSTMHEFLISRRIVSAMEMLRSQKNSVGDVAYRCGFQSLHHFTKSFKARVGMTPSAYRQRVV